MAGMKITARVPMDIQFMPAWLSWVGATTTCLRALGVDCELADVAGYSGYAFMQCVNEGLCPSGPTMCDWGMLDGGVNMLGRSTLAFGCSDCHTKDTACDRTREHCRVAYELAEREVAAGRPCVLWGAYLPEFAVVTGVDKGQYIVKSIKGHCGEPEPPIPYDALDAPGGPYVLAFPTPAAHHAGDDFTDRYAVGLAARLLRQPTMFANYGFGLASYDTWIAALREGKLSGFGNAYNAQCYAERTRLAQQFLARVAARQPLVAEPLARAAKAYETAATEMAKVAALFPFPGAGEHEDAQRREQAAGALADAQVAESAAASALSEALYMQWEPAQEAGAAQG